MERRLRAPLAVMAFAVACGRDPSAGGAAATGDRATVPGDAAAADPSTASTAPSGTTPEPDDASADAGSDGGPSDAGFGPDSALVVARPYNFRVPAGYDPTKPTPLVVALHGYADWGAKIDGYFGFGTIVDAKGFLYAYPDGSVEPLSGNRFWNATDACCNLTFLPVDDVAYLNAVLDDIEAKYNVDPKRIFVVGHSNGGFMSHRFACDAAPRVAAIASLGGAQWFDPTRCTPAAKVSVLEVHGDDDQTIHYGGGIAAALYPSAPTTAATWATKNGCTGALTPTGTMLDVDTAIAGEETRVARYGGCTDVDVELWTVQGGPHIPPLAQPGWPEMIWGFLSAHPKP